MADRGGLWTSARALVAGSLFPAFYFDKSQSKFQAPFVFDTFFYIILSIILVIEKINLKIQYK